MKIVAIFSSPKENDGPHTLGFGVLNAAMGLSTNTIQIHNLCKIPTLKDCQHCDPCKHGKDCMYNDGLERVVSDVLECDALVISVPAYSENINATYKMFEDRLCCLLGDELQSKIDSGKKLITIVTCTGDVSEAQDTKNKIENKFIEIFKFEPLGSVVFSTEENSETDAVSEEVMDSAIRLGRLLNPHFHFELSYLGETNSNDA